MNDGDVCKVTVKCADVTLAPVEEKQILKLREYCHLGCKLRINCIGWYLGEGLSNVNNFNEVSSQTVGS